MRIPDAYGPGHHQDLALASSGRRPFVRHALVLGREFARAFYSSILPYRFGHRTVIFGAKLHQSVESAGQLEVRILAAPARGAWCEFGSIRLDRVVDEVDARRLRFNPWNSGGGIRPLGVLNALRDPAYRGSQMGSSG
jgi:hypothetical protein